MTEHFSLSQAFQQWEQAFETISGRLEKLEQEIARLDQLDQRIEALEQRLVPASQPPIAPAAQARQPIPFGAKHPSVQEKLRLGLPPPVRARVARWLGEHGLNEQTCRAWGDMPLDDLHATLLYAQQRIATFAKTRAPGRVLYRCDNPDCPC